MRAYAGGSNSDSSIIMLRPPLHLAVPRPVALVFGSCGVAEKFSFRVLDLLLTPGPVVSCHRETFVSACLGFEHRLCGSVRFRADDARNASLTFLGQTHLRPAAYLPRRCGGQAVTRL